jgi:hypothetical protein
MSKHKPIPVPEALGQRFLAEKGPEVLVECYARASTGPEGLNLLVALRKGAGSAPIYENEAVLGASGPSSSASLRFVWNAVMGSVVDAMALDARKKLGPPKEETSGHRIHPRKPRRKFKYDR